MDFDDSPEEAQFRTEVRDWIENHVVNFAIPPNATPAEEMQLTREWIAEKAKAGYVGFGLPNAIGGRGGSMIEEVIFADEQTRAGAPHSETLTLGTGMVLPTMLNFAQPEMLQRLARPTLSAEILWCQLFSEPGAGSDLAGIRTRAVRDGDAWVVNGQKVWTSGAHLADWGLLLTRTDPEQPKHKGLTYFLVDMHAPGVEVRPLKQISGLSEFNEVFFTDVRIRDLYRVGEVNMGWIVAMTTMQNERLALIGDNAVARNLIKPLLRLGQRIKDAEGQPLITDSAFCDRVASYYSVVSGLEHMRKRIITSLSKGKAPGFEATLGKMTVSRWLQEMAAFGMDIAGAAGQVIDPDDLDLAEIQHSYFRAPGYRMGGGTEEIAKNIIAERLLGLPQDVRVDKNVPFNQLRDDRYQPGRGH